MAELHINIGMIALSRGFITLDTFAKAIEKLAQSERQSIYELWAGCMSPEQINAALDAVKGNSPSKAPDTMVVQTETPVTRKHTPTFDGTAPTAASLVTEPPPPGDIDTTKPVPPPSGNDV